MTVDGWLVDQFELDAGEHLINRCSACHSHAQLTAGFTRHWGRLILTNKRLAFVPFKLSWGFSPTKHIHVWNLSDVACAGQPDWSSLKQGLRSALMPERLYLHIGEERHYFGPLLFRRGPLMKFVRDAGIRLCEEDQDHH
jgi:hypothetical protein